jgi:hypothetical protein
MTYRQTNDPSNRVTPFRRQAVAVVRDTTALLLCAFVALGACTNATFEKVSTPDAGEGKKDAAVPNPDVTDAPVTTRTCEPGAGDRSKGKAQACDCDDECQSGHCADGVCCTSACDETCKACNLPSSLGDCAHVPAGGKPGDPSDCTASAPRTCGQDGTCDGRGGCRLYVKGTECKAGTCDGDRVADIQTCDGNGNCSQTVSQTCPPYTCDKTTNRCAFACTTNAQCAASQECVAGRCGTSANGAVCRSAEDCSSGYCVDGVCCNIACSGPCMSCNQTGSVGRCTVVTAGIEDPDCDADDVSTCGHTGRCDGAGSCAFYSENTVCVPSSCSGVQENAPRTCDGRGTCRSAELIRSQPQ